MGIIAFMIYVGGSVASPDNWGFWKTAFWPYYLGKFLVVKISQEGI